MKENRENGTKNSSGKKAKRRNITKKEWKESKKEKIGRKRENGKKAKLAGEWKKKG